MLELLECHKVPRLPRETRLRDDWNLQSDHLCRSHHRHGHTVLTWTVADGCERLRTAADGCKRLRTSSKHTLNPQTPRVKREPLLRIRENVFKKLIIPARDPKQCAVRILQGKAGRVIKHGHQVWGDVSPIYCIHRFWPCQTSLKTCKIPVVKPRCDMTREAKRGHHNWGQASQFPLHRFSSGARGSSTPLFLNPP